MKTWTARIVVTILVLWILAVSVSFVLYSVGETKSIQIQEVKKP